MQLSELITEVQALSGREGDTELVTSSRVARWLNESQTEIVRYCIGHLDLETKDADAITLVNATYSYSFASLTTAVFHLLRVVYMDGAQSFELTYRDTAQFDNRHPDPSQDSGIPSEWTRRGSAIEVWPTPTSSEAGKYLRLDYTAVPTALSADDDESDMSDCDRGLIYFAVSEAFRAIGDTEQANEYRNPRERTGAFYDWLAEYRTWKDGFYMTESDHLFE